jgi:hypothetical protein
MTCDLCGRPLASSNQYGVCSSGGKSTAPEACQKEYRKRVRRKHPPNYPDLILSQIKRRAKVLGLAFELTWDTLPPIPSNCPVLGIPLKHNLGAHGAAPTSPSLDRIVPERGYVPGNVQWISYKANVMKHNATPDELRRFAEWVLAAFPVS